MTTIQCFCTLNDLVADSEGTPGLPAGILQRFILPASLYVMGEIGDFLPVTETRKRTGKGTDILFIPPLLRLTGSVINDDTTLTTDQVLVMSTLQSDAPWWQHGPYCVLRMNPENASGFIWSEEPNSLEIPGVWGMYERTDATGAVLGSTQTVGATAIVVDDGSKVSVGMMLQIGTEMEFVYDLGAPTASVTTLGAGLDATADLLTLANGALVKVGEIIRVDFEQMKVIEIQTNAVYVERGWNKTRKAAHLTGAAVAVYRTFYVNRACNGTTAAEHLSAVAVSRYLVPQDINYLTRQIAMLMMRKAGTGYSGRSGSTESGETFYTHEFPKDVITRIAGNYYIPAAR